MKTETHTCKKATHIFTGRQEQAGLKGQELRLVELPENPQGISNRRSYKLVHNRAMNSTQLKQLHEATLKELHASQVKRARLSHTTHSIIKL